MNIGFWVFYAVIWDLSWNLYRYFNLSINIRVIQIDDFESATSNIDLCASSFLNRALITVARSL